MCLVPETEAGQRGLAGGRLRAPAVVADPV